MNIEEVKKILRQARYGAVPFKMGSNPGSWHLGETAITDYAHQICQLFKKDEENSEVKLPQVVGRGGEANDEPKFDNSLEADAHNWDTRELRKPKPEREIPIEQTIANPATNAPKQEVKDERQIEEFHHPLWAKILFYPFYSLWLGWCYLLGCEILVDGKDRKWLLK